MNDKVHAFCKKGQIWLTNIKHKNYTYLHILFILKLYLQLLKIIWLYEQRFSVFYDRRNLIAKYEWVRDSFQNKGLPIDQAEMFIDFMASGEIKRQFSNKSKHILVRDG